MEDLDALLADLQATNPSASTTSPPRSDSPPPPLPPPPSFEALDPNGRERNGEDIFSQRDHSLSLNANLSELDSLLEDLSSPMSFGTTSESSAKWQNAEPSRSSPTNPPQKHIKNGRPAVGAPDGRPSVEALLNELDSAVQHKQHSTTSHVTPPTPQRSQMQYEPETGDDMPFKTASSATKELDDLMASLSDFKVNTAVSTPTALPAGLRHSGDYAKPQKGNTPSTVGKVSQLDSMLGSLQSDMTRQGVSTTKKGMCAACNKPIIGQVCTALGRTWHPEHFTCVACDMPLGTRNFFERDGKPYCEKDYHDQFAPRCAYCNGPILDSCETALGQTWHPECFVCAQCGKPFSDGGFHERDDKAYCREDYYAMFAPRCGGCGQPIMDSYISALSAHWHPECFVCAECHQAFPGGSFFEHDGRPYCEMHYHARRGTLCYSCQKPITGRCITAMHRKFHPEHFVCAFCLKQLNKGTFKEQNDKPYCHPCFIKLFG